MLGYGCDGRLTPEEAVRQIVMVQASHGVELPQGLQDEMLRVARGEQTAEDLLAKLRRLYGETAESEAT
jgi:hypothetical protein